VLWVLDTDGKWYSFPNLVAEDNVETSYDIKFDHPVNVAELVMQPVNDYSNFSWRVGYSVSNVIFAN